MKVLVTGGCGFIGTNLVGRLVEEGVDVVVVDDQSGYDFEAVRRFELVLYYDQGILDYVRYPMDDSFDVIYHLAAHYANVRSLEEPRLSVRTNVEGTMAMLEFALQMGCKRFVYASSSGVYGEVGALALHEDLTPNPNTPYEVGKLSGELLCRGYARIYGMEVVCLRIFNAYGWWDRAGKYRSVLPNFYLKALRGEDLVVTGKSATRDYTYVDDVVEAFVRAGSRSIDSPLVTNVGTGRETFIVDLAWIINEYCGNKSQIIVKDQRKWDNTLSRWADVGRLGDTLGFVPSISLREGLEESNDWYTNIGG